MVIARMIVRSGLLTVVLMSAVQRELFAALRDYLLDQTISLSECDLSECAVDLAVC
jgi:hypothetical protein